MPGIKFDYLIALLLIPVLSLSQGPEVLRAQSTISLAGQWQVSLDRNDVGLQQQWYQRSLPTASSLVLPGSIQEQGFGDDPSAQTDWVATNFDAFFKLDKYAPYRSDDNFKFPFWLTPDKYYKGVSWFQRRVNIPDGWSDKRIVMELERAHWGTMVFVDDTQVGADSSLTTPHRYDLTDELTPGEHTITLRVDNRILYDVGLNAHSVTDHTQTNWNGVVGRLALKAESPLYIDDVQIYPDVANKQAKVRIKLVNETGQPRQGRLNIRAHSQNAEQKQSPAGASQSFSINDEKEIEFTYDMGDDPLLWSEFNPAFYTMEVKLESPDFKDNSSVDFGMRNFEVSGKRFAINGRPVFLRGTLECAIFPLTGYPHMKKTEWAHHFDVLKQHGLNHMRFHSWSPPEAAFEAADEAGIYLQVEAPVWVNQGARLGEGKPVDQFIYDETRRIMKEYGNHPSFVMFSAGNEPSGDHYKEYLAKFVNTWKKRDNRRVYTAGSGWPTIDENDYHLTPEPRIQQWGEGLKSEINAKPPTTDWSFNEEVDKYDKPLVGHEIGQWCVYPNFDEMSKYTGVLYPRNFEIFRDFLEQNHMLQQAHDFLMASGKLQVLNYKADIETALRTADFAGYQMLDLHDFPGQGTALVGILDPFWDSKPYISANEFKRFSAPTVPLAVMKKRSWTTGETFRADLEIAHFAADKATDVPVKWYITDNSHNVLARGQQTVDLPIGNKIPAGSVSFDLGDIQKVQKLNLEVEVAQLGTNDWDFWVFPQQVDTAVPNDVVVTDALTPTVEQQLNNGAKVLLRLDGKIQEGKGKNVEAGFSTVFWNTAWTGGQAPHTLGVLVDPTDALFADFPTDYYTDWQWWDIVHEVQPMILDDLPANLTPGIQMIDTWFDAHKLGLLFEGKVGDGKLVVTTIDFENNLDNRLASRQLYHSLLNYMKGDTFNPGIQLSVEQVRSLYE